MKAKKKAKKEEKKREKEKMAHLFGLERKHQGNGRRKREKEGKPIRSTVTVAYYGISGGGSLHGKLLCGFALRGPPVHFP